MTKKELKSLGYKTLKEINKNYRKSDFPPDFLKNGIKCGGIYYPPEMIFKIIEYKNIPKAEKYRRICLEKYNVENISCLKEIQAKKENTCLEHFGVSNPLKDSSIKEKIKQTNLEKYNVENTFQIPKAKSNLKLSRTKKYFFDNRYFDSSWELAYYFYLKDVGIPFGYQEVELKYLKDGKICSYWPDFKVLDRLVEIKGEQFFKDGKLYNPFEKVFLTEKENCMKENNVLVLRKLDIIPFLNYTRNKLGDLNQFKEF